MTTVITPAIERLVGLLVQAFAESKSEPLIIDREAAYTIADTYAQAIGVVARGGVSPSEEQMDEVALADDLLLTLNQTWSATREAKVRDLQSLLRDNQRLTQAVLDRLQVLIESEPDEAAREREIRLEIAKEIIPKFGTAAYRWLGPDSTDMSRFAAEQRADTLANILLMHLLIDECIDPMRIAQNVRNEAKANGTTFSGQAISKRIFQVIA